MWKCQNWWVASKNEVFKHKNYTVVHGVDTTYHYVGQPRILYSFMTGRRFLDVPATDQTNVEFLVNNRGRWREITEFGTPVNKYVRTS